MFLQNNFGGFSSIEEYLANFWWNMHHSDDPNKQAWAFSVRCYLDESGTHDQSPFTVVAGLLLNRHNFISLGKLWNDLLRDMRIKVPIHMKEFGRPDGKLGYLTDSERYYLFINIADIINSHKIFSIASSIGQEEYRKILKLNKRKEMSPHGLCFIHCAFTNHIIAEKNNYSKDIAFLLSEVSEHRGQLLAGHAEMKRVQHEGPTPYHIGSISFDYPINVPALQAADVVSWGVRRRLIGDPFNQGFDYIEDIITKKHVEEPWSNTDLHGLAQRIMKYKNQDH